MLNLNTLDKKAKNEIRSTIIILLLVFPYFQPQYWNFPGTFSESFYNVAKILSAAIMWSYYLYYCIKNKHVSILYISYFVLQLYIFGNTVIQFGIYRNVLMNFITSVTFLMVIDCFLQTNPKELIHSMLIILEILIIINFVYLLIHPDGLYGSYKHFLGNRCLFIIYTTLALTMSLLWKNYTGKSLRFYILLVICIISTLIEGSATGKLAIILYLFLIITNLYKTKIITLGTGLIGYMVLFFAGIVFRLQKYFSHFLALLGKNTSLSGRTELWDESINYILQRPFFGYGFVESASRENMIGYIHSHNFILEHLFIGGFVELLLVALFMFFVIKYMKNAKNQIQSKVIIIGIYMMLMHMLVEAGQKPLCYILFFMLAYCQNICNYMPIKCLKKDKVK